MARASVDIVEALHGKQPYSSLSEACQSALRIHIYLRAKAILELPREHRAEAAFQLPEDIRDLVREECKRLLKLRNS